MVPTLNIHDWLKEQCAEFHLEPLAIYRKGMKPVWPLTAADEEQLLHRLAEGGHLLPLPKEPAALANVVEVAVVDYIVERASRITGTTVVRGSERGYPDIEMSGDAFGGGFHAVDIKVARRSKSRRQTDSRITLYTGNTYFRYPTLQWPGMFRPFDDYATHLDIIVLYTLVPDSNARISDMELLVCEPWRIASKQRSSTTREYLGAVMDIAALREGRGEFASSDEFYRFWRKYSFKTGKVVEQQLRKLMNPPKQASKKSKPG